MGRQNFYKNILLCNIVTPGKISHRSFMHDFSSSILLSAYAAEVPNHSQTASDFSVETHTVLPEEMVV